MYKEKTVQISRVYAQLYLLIFTNQLEAFHTKTKTFFVKNDS